MKYLYLFLILVLYSCGSGSSSNPTASNNGDNSSTQADVIAEFKLDAETSTINWERILDQKATKKKIKLFGAWADVELGPMKLNMNGNVTPTRGGMSTINDECAEGHFIFDMTTFKFAEEQGQGLFDTKQYPESELRLVRFEPLAGDSVNNYTAYMELTIQDATQALKAPLNIEIKNSALLMTGDFVFNTLDFPLRDNAKKSEVNKDEITVILDLVYMKE